MRLDQMGTTNSIERIFIESFKSKLSENEKQYRDFVQEYVYYMEPSLFDHADEPFTLIKVGQPILNHSKSTLQAPTEETFLREAQEEQFQFPGTWVKRCDIFARLKSNN